MASRMLDLLYNCVLVILVVSWILAIRRSSQGRAIEILRRRSAVISILLWIAFIAFLVSFIVRFDYFSEIHDIDDAVDAATSHFLKGGNPYVDEVVPRFSEKYHPDPEFANGTYNYLPLDLLVYSGADYALGPMGSPVWFVAMNLVFSAAALYLFRRVVNIAWIPYIPVAGIVMIFYSYDNASFTLLLMVASIYFWRMRTERMTYLAILLLSLATLTKVYAAIPLVVLVLFELQSRISGRDLRRLGGLLMVVGGCAVLAVLLMLPFGVSNVLDSAVFFHASEQSRQETSAGGTLLSEIAMDSPYYGVISAVFVLAALVMSLKLRNLDDRILLVMSVFLLVAVKSSYAPLTVLGVYLGSRLHDVVQERLQKQKLEDKAMTTSVPQ